MNLVCMMATLKRNEGFLHGRASRQTAWMGWGVDLEHRVQHNGRDGGGIILEKRSQTSATEKCQYQDPPVNTQDQETGVKGENPAAASGHVFIQRSYFLPGWAACILFKFSVAFVTINLSSPHLGDTLSCPGLTPSWLFPRPLGKSLVPYVLPSPLPTLGFCPQLGYLASSSA